MSKPRRKQLAAFMVAAMLPAFTGCVLYVGEEITRYPRPTTMGSHSCDITEYGVYCAPFKFFDDKDPFPTPDVDPVLEKGRE